eukprot:CAMPEP_0174882930 /NCGR_PEP_ID=MMETSP1114-20130205/85012_1 /TAXON_ID=312471 /ORGANISM="Neobodo designis, Strain CCAP 1951/1" /LENGTH=136 /DNA_ID=CAMNT_0016118331 /DNA_START=79 /DNA_END=490 /DNA_ORIENTATION=+
MPYQAQVTVCCVSVPADATVGRVEEGELAAAAKHKGKRKPWSRIARDLRCRRKRQLRGENGGEKYGATVALAIAQFVRAPSLPPMFVEASSRTRTSCIGRQRASQRASQRERTSHTARSFEYRCEHAANLTTQAIV